MKKLHIAPFFSKLGLKMFENKTAECFMPLFGLGPQTANSTTVRAHIAPVLHFC